VERILEVKSEVGAGFIRPQNTDEGINDIITGSINASPTDLLEFQIDELVFELYGLSAEERGVVLS